MPSLKTKPYLYFLALYALNNMILAVYGTFFPVYLAQAGYGQAAIGVLLAVGPLVTIAAQPFWGPAGDRARSKNAVLLAALLGSAAVLAAYRLSTSFAFLLVATALYTFFQSPVLPMSDTVTLEYATEAGWRFGRIRLAGTIGYAVAAVLTGLAARRRVENIFPLSLLAIVLTILAVLRLPGVRGHQAGEGRVPLRVLLRHRQLMLLMAFSSIVHATLGFYYSFFPVYCRQMSADNALLGWSTAITALSEVPFLLLAERIVKRVGIRGMLLISAAVTAARWLLFYLAADPYLLLPLQVLHGAAYIVLTYCLATYINAEVPKELRASGQALHWLLTAGVARIIGSFGGGLLASAVGIRAGFLIGSIVIGLALLIFVPLFRRMEAREGAQPGLGSDL
ncbi:MAG: MFS transporter [Bacteroidota bacterium]